MLSLRILAVRLRAIFVARLLDKDLDEELRSHIEMETEANMARGMSREEARFAALREFGGVARTAEAYRSQRGLPFFETLAQDVRYALRVLRKSPGFTAVAILSLALGIGANTAIFTLSDQVLMRALPVQNPEELVRFDAPGVAIGMQRNSPHTVSYPVYKALREQTRVFRGVLAHFLTSINLSHNGQTDRVTCDIVSGNYFQVLGLRPAAGRLFTDADDQKPGAHPVAVLTFGYWQRRFGSDPSIVGRTLIFNKTPMTVVGVAPAGFRGVTVDDYPDVLVPLMMKPQMILWWPQIDHPRQAWLDVFARLAPGVSREEAQAAMDVFYRSHLAEDAKTITGIPENVRKEFLAGRLVVMPGIRGISDTRRVFASPLKLLLAMVGVVLLIACANLAGLLSARAAARRTEFAIRIALGAGRGRLLRQLMIESLILALAGGTAGLAVATMTARGFIALLPFEEMARGLQSSLDTRALLFNLGVSLLAAVLFGLIPALQTTRPAVAPSLRNEAGASSGLGTARFRRALVAAQVALSLVLTVAAGLFARTLYNLKSSDSGFEKEKLVLVSIEPTLNGYAEQRMRSLLDNIEGRLKSIPGVRAVGIAGWGPFNSTFNQNIVKMEGSDERRMVNAVGIGPGTLWAVRLPLLAGREFTQFDTRSSPKVAIITASLARRYFGGKAVGKRFGDGDSTEAPDTEIVGVVPDVTPPEPRHRRDFIFFPMRQWDVGVATFHVLTALPPDTLFGPIRAAVRSADPDVPVTEMKTMAAYTDEALFAERMIALLSSCFGGLALLLAALGLYGVIAWSVARRTREIGIRIALGASTPRVLTLVMKDVLWMLGAGLLVAVPAVFALFGLVRSELYQVQPEDPATLAAATALLAAIAIVAGLLPARRALRVNIVSALRYE